MKTETKHQSPLVERGLAILRCDTRKNSQIEHETASESALKPTSDDITEGRIIAVEICSNVLDADIWLAFDDDFNPGGGQAVFYADELEFLKTKDTQMLREIHRVKLAFGPGSRVRQ